MIDAWVKEVVEESVQSRELEIPDISDTGTQEEYKQMTVSPERKQNEILMNFWKILLSIFMLNFHANKSTKSTSSGSGSETKSYGNDDTLEVPEIEEEEKTE